MYRESRERRHERQQSVKERERRKSVKSSHENIHFGCRERRHEHESRARYDGTQDTLPITFPRNITYYKLGRRGAAALPHGSYIGPLTNKANPLDSSSVQASTFQTESSASTYID